MGHDPAFRSQIGMRRQHGFDSRHILGIVQFPELSPAPVNLDAEDGVTMFEETQLLQPFEFFELAHGKVP